MFASTAPSSEPRYFLEAGAFWQKMDKSQAKYQIRARWEPKSGVSLRSWGDIVSCGSMMFDPNSETLLKHS